MDKLTLFLLITLLGSWITPFAQPTFRSQLLCVDNNEGCTLADVNRDGKTDVIAGRLWYEAPEFVPRPLRPLRLHGTDYATNNGEHSYDVDQDGYPDILTTGWDDPHVYWYKNPGAEALQKGLEWKGSALANTQNTHSEAAYLEDLDGDGVPEYIMNSWDARIPFTVWRMEKDLFEHPSLIGTLIGPHNSHGVGFGDINGDGQKDILIDTGWYEQPDGDIWEGNWTFHSDLSLDRGSCPMQIVDVNGDGRNDIIWGKGHDYGLYWMEQQEPKGEITQWVKHTIDESWSQVHALSWADLDGDGKHELLTGKRKYAHSGKDPGADETAYIYSYSWNSTTDSFDRTTIAEGIGTGLFIRVADLNQDQKADIVVAGKTGTYILWQE
ncbi:MAG: VCBS repeat-containing protein [Bacteroidota bacterium]